MVIEGKRKFELALGLWVLNIIVSWHGVESQCSGPCAALASYYIWPGSNLTFISQVLSSPLYEIQIYNPDLIANPYNDQSGIRVNIPFSCGCIRDQFHGNEFLYTVGSGESYELIAKKYYANLTTTEMLKSFNSYNPNSIESIPENSLLHVPVYCSCGNSDVSREYGLFITYPLRPGENLSTIAGDFNLPEKLLQDYNPNSNFNSGSGWVFIPGKDRNGTYPPFNSSSSDGIRSGVIAGIVVAGIAGALLLAICFYFGSYRRKKVVKGLLGKTSESGPLIYCVSPELMGIAVDKSVEFSYEELAKATDDFSMANKIGQGGFGIVYYAELRGEKAAIKKMDMQASKEFLAELKVLTHVHHFNLVRLIGYCVEGSLFLVYEFIENGNLSQHLRDLGRDPLPWSTRVQIALDSARGLEYIHENTVPLYIHRDIKSENILIDKNFHAKVADFGLTKLTIVGSTSLPTRLVGTFGYMSPEYAQYGEVSPKIDVYAFGVVLYELISAKKAIVKANEVVSESKGLVALFEDFLNQPDPKEDLCKLVDPRLGDDYPLDSVLKMAHLARACTQENPQLRPSMRSIVVALMAFSSSTEDWDVGSFYENQGLVNQMTGR